MALQRSTIKTSIGVDIGCGDEAVDIVAANTTVIPPHAIGGLLCAFSGRLINHQTQIGI